jgi:hypothetical protein
VSDSTPDGIRVRSRVIGRVYPDDDTVIVIDHVYEPEGGPPCEHCGGQSHDPGMVGLVVSSLLEDDDDGEPDPVSVLMTAETALLVANRLTRAANLVLESEESLPDIEREAARFAPVEGTAGE